MEEFIKDWVWKVKALSLPKDWFEKTFQMADLEREFESFFKGEKKNLSEEQQLALFELPMAEFVIRAYYKTGMPLCAKAQLKMAELPHAELLMSEYMVYNSLHFPAHQKLFQLQRARIEKEQKQREQRAAKLSGFSPLIPETLAKEIKIQGELKTDVNIEDTVKKIVADIACVDLYYLDDHARLRDDLGLGSLEIMLVDTQLENSLNISISERGYVWLYNIPVNVLVEAIKIAFDNAK